MGREGGVGIQSMEMGYRQEDRRKNILGRDCNIGQNTFKNNQLSYKICFISLCQKQEEMGTREEK